MKHFEQKKLFNWNGFNLIALYVSYDFDDCDINDIQFENGNSIDDYFLPERVEKVRDYFLKVMRENSQINEMNNDFREAS